MCYYMCGQNSDCLSSTSTEVMKLKRSYPCYRIKSQKTTSYSKQGTTSRLNRIIYLKAESFREECIPQIRLILKHIYLLFRGNK